MEAPYGSWTSPISGRLIAEGGVGLGWPQALKDSLFWVEQRPLEEGRYVVVRRDRDARIADVTPRDHNARTLVHEYGGGMYRAFRTPEGGESVIFSGYADQRLYRQDLPVGPGGGRRGALERAAPDHAAAAGRTRLALRRRGRDTGWLAADLRARTSRRRHGRERPRRRPLRRVFRASRPGPGPRLLLEPQAEPGRRPARVARSGTTRTCRGTAPSCGSPRSTPTATSRTRPCSPEAPRSRCSSRSGVAAARSTS